MANLSCAALLVRTRVGAGAQLTSRGSPLAAAGVDFELEPLFVTAPEGAALPGAAPGAGWQWQIARPKQSLDGANGWALAHNAVARSVGLAATSDLLIEPDFEQQWPLEEAGRPGATLAAGPAAEFEDQDSDWPAVPRRFAWHLDDDFTQLRAARSQARAEGSGGVVRIMHLDTGYDAAHPALQSARLRHDLERDFLTSPPGSSAVDPGQDGLLRNPGHGTGTLSILAGGPFALNGHGYDFHDTLGAAPDAEVVPVRVGNAVVQVRTSSAAAGIAYAAELAADPATRVHVISMSMGGVASAAWADAVNRAYEAGVVFVAAAGNNFSAGLIGLPTHFIVYPARFRRVLAACGVMANHRPYYGLPVRQMQGNWGPASKMATALATFTPNIPWARWGDQSVRLNGAGTSAATPQIAAAAALYFQRHFAALHDPAKYPEPWMRVEAVRRALFGNADRAAASGHEDKLGNGILQAARALAEPPAEAAALQKTAPDRAVFPFLRALTGLGAAPSAADAMLALEATQLAQRSWGDGATNPFERDSTDPDLPAEAIPGAEQRRFIDALRQHPDASPQLKARLEAWQSASGAVSRRPAKPRERPAAPAGPTAAPEPCAPITRFTPPPPPFRCLRGFAIDPSLATQLQTAPISEVNLHVRWEPVQPGPRGEYLEVVDLDPGSGCAYEPVDLDDHSLLAQDGLAPSEGTPQFHQQMVYAVASLTIEHFERALGRRTLWRPGPPAPGRHVKNDATFVQRLRVHPHALREANAYYSPQKIALLFGYFNASADAPGEHLPGGRVFTCLSHDIIAHETTHALLDGMHRRFLNPTNLDVHAFHEAFADIVALFQHFTFPEIVRHQINATRGAVRTHINLLGQLAGQFGAAIGSRGALRDAIGKMVNGEWVPAQPDPAEYDRTTEPHARGAILVAAVFDAFLAIYEHRIQDLLRLATNGTGILQPGAIHPDLAQRLADESAKSAGHVLGMCVRALDYCPPVDITFGEYLRALVTADFDLVPDDDLNYRVAFVEAFRRRGIYPRNVRTLSVESLLWRDAEQDVQRPSSRVTAGLERLRAFAEKALYADTREKVFHLERSMRADLHEWLEEHLLGSAGASDAAFLGLDPARPFEVHTARFAHRVSPDGEVRPQLLLGLLQDQLVPLDPADPNGEMMTVEGGCTIVADLRSRTIGYCIRKSLTSENRIERQRAFAAAAGATARAIYFGRPVPGADPEPFAALHRGH